MMIQSRVTPFPKILVALLVLAGLVLNGCALSMKDFHPDVVSEPSYDELYPYYAEICAVSRIRAVFAEEGGTPGHASMYLKGACMDDTAAYPRIKLCDPNTIDLTTPESGVGVSVNKTFKNVNWMAVKGKRLFFDGNLDVGEELDKERALATIDYAMQAGIWSGIEIHDQYKPPVIDEEAVIRFVASESLGTDFAFRFGRHVFCANMPMPREQLGLVVDYLNALNDEYASGKAEYNWSGYSDNCSHVLHNSLAYADVWKAQSTNTSKLKQLFNLSVPANEMAKLALLANQYPLEDFNRIYNDPVKRATLLKKSWLPMRHGALIQYLGIHQNNRLYNTEAELLILELPLLRPISRQLNPMWSDPRFTRVGDNLIYFKSRYQEILAERPKTTPGPNDEFGQARQRYYEYIEAQLADVNDKLARLGVATPRLSSR